MRPQNMLILLAGLCASPAFAAEPAKAPAEKTEQATQDQQRPVVVASASEAQAKLTHADQQTGTAAPKPRRGRSTSCRCGDQLPND